MRYFINIIIIILLITGVNYAQTDNYGSFYNNGILTNLGAPGRYAAIQHANILEIQQQGTIEAWIYMTAYNANHSIIYGKGGSFILAVGSSAINNRPFLNINSSTFFSTSVDPIPLNRWVHLAASWSTAGNQITVSFFVDGLLAGVNTQVQSVSNNTDSVTIGGSIILPNSFFSGHIDEVRFWSRARFASEVARTRFIGIGDAPSSDFNGAITLCEEYDMLRCSWTFNDNGALATENISNRHAVLTGGAAKNITNILGQPIPYNQAVFFPGGANNQVGVRDNPAFDLTTQGTIDGWVYPTTGTAGRVLISKGSPLSNSTFRILLAGPSNILTFYIGNFTMPGPGLPGNRWSHFAVTWSLSGGIYTVRLYANGVLNGVYANSISMPLNSDSLFFGNSPKDNLPFSGYMDEMRIWNKALTHDEIRAYEFVSAKQGGAFFQNNLVAHWGFDGDLKAVSTINDLEATFNNGLIDRNDCRFSSYLNEDLTGPITTQFKAHCTAIKKRDDNSFPGGFAMRSPNKNLPVNTDVYDTISFSSNTSLSNIEVFLSIDQHEINPSSVILRAPNGTERALLSPSVGQGSHVISFFKDGSNSMAVFYPPWSYSVAPIQTFGNFGGTGTQGNWILKVKSMNSVYSGRLLGWGIRVNNTLSNVQQISSEVPVKYELYQNYPNPFNPVTNISFDISGDVNVRLAVYDLLGREVQVLADEYKKAGSYNVNYDASHLASGTYFYKLTAGNFTDVKKMIIIK